MERFLLQNVVHRSSDSQSGLAMKFYMLLVLVSVFVGLSYQTPRQESAPPEKLPPDSLPT